MQKILFISLALLLSLLAGCKVFSGKVTVNGQVVNPVTGEPIQGMEIALYEGSPNLFGNGTLKYLKDDVSDSDGRFHFDFRPAPNEMVDYRCKIISDFLDAYIPHGKNTSGVASDLDKEEDSEVVFELVPKAYSTSRFYNDGYVSDLDSMIVDSSYHVELGVVHRGPSDPFTGHPPISSNPLWFETQMGTWVVAFRVIRGGVTTHHRDTIWLPAGEKTYWDIHY